MSQYDFLDTSGTKQRTIKLAADNHLKLYDAADPPVEVTDELKDVSDHASRHSSGGADPIPAAGLRMAQLFSASGSSTGTGAEQTIAHGLGVVPAWVSLIATNELNDIAPALTTAADATNIYVRATNGAKYNWRAIA